MHISPWMTRGREGHKASSYLCSPLMNIHLTEIPHSNPQSHFGTTSPVQNAAIESLSGLLLLLSYLHLTEKGSMLRRFLASPMQGVGGRALVFLF